MPAGSAVCSACQVLPPGVRGAACLPLHRLPAVATLVLPAVTVLRFTVAITVLYRLPGGYHITVLGAFCDALVPFPGSNTVLPFVLISRYHSWSSSTVRSAIHVSSVLPVLCSLGDTVYHSFWRSVRSAFYLPATYRLGACHRYDYTATCHHVLGWSGGRCLLEEITIKWGLPGGYHWNSTILQMRFLPPACTTAVRWDTCLHCLMGAVRNSHLHLPPLPAPVHRRWVSGCQGGWATTCRLPAVLPFGRLHTLDSCHNTVSAFTCHHSGWVIILGYLEQVWASPASALHHHWVTLFLPAPASYHFTCSTDTTTCRCVVRCVLPSCIRNTAGRYHDYADTCHRRSHRAITCTCHLLRSAMHSIHST